MKIALIGYGNMGKEIEKVLSETKNHEIVSVSYRKTTDGLDKEGIKKADVALDFTSPEIVLNNTREVASLGKNLVIGTTGWYDNLEEVKSLVKENNIGLIYGQNFSIGANIFFKIVAFGSSLLSRFGDYDVFGYEIHHKGKKDSPSGTARKLSSLIMKNFPSKKTLQENKLDRQIKDEELHFASVRGGHNTGLHEVVFDSQADEIGLTHRTHGRRGFAEGAIMAAEFIDGKKGLYTVDDLFDQENLK
ncbi:MAG: 4-hydroxy-tetrahydrodipicolinate reductase [bacterium]|nr:4-hydroxy-tetrahydrodipicolinate reductase [bacterium]